MLTQATLKDFYDVTNELADVRAKVRHLEKLQSANRDIIIRELRGKRKKEIGPYKAILKDGPRVVRWKAEFIRINGENKADEILSRTEPSIRVRVTVVDLD